MCFLARFIILDILLLPTALLFILEESGNLNCEAIKKDASNHKDFCTFQAGWAVTLEKA